MLLIIVERVILFAKASYKRYAALVRKKHVHRRIEIVILKTFHLLKTIKNTLEELQNSIVIKIRSNWNII